MYPLYWTTSKGGTYQTPRVFFLVILVDRSFQYVVEHILAPLK